jgi:hypothetical protein
MSNNRCDNEHYDCIITTQEGAVFLQLCDWMGAWHLWAGAVSDTNYQHSRVFIAVHSFAFKELYQNVSVTRSYRIPTSLTKNSDAQWLFGAGKQLMLQFSFAKSDGV